jgi:hypothetical protein
MTMLFGQPDTPTVDEPLTPAGEACAACGESAVHQYRVVDYRGWLRVTKCRACLHVAVSERIEPPVQAGVA